MLFTTEKVLLEGDAVPAPACEHPRVRRSCPRCDSQSVARSRIRGALGHVAKNMLGVRPYRCLDCWHRFMGSVRQ